MKSTSLSHVRNFELEEQIRKLNKIGIALSSEQNLNRLLEVIVREARAFTRADGGSLYIRENDRLNFTVAQTESLDKRGDKRKPFTSFYLPLSKESIAGYVALTGKILNIKDVYEVPAEVEYKINKVFDNQNNYRSQSMLVVPMRDTDGEIIGVLQLINSLRDDGSVRIFKKEYESLVHSLASQAAVAIRNVKLLNEIKNLFKSLVRYSAKAIDARSPHTAGHSGRVAKFSVRIAEAINDESDGGLQNVNFSPEEIEELRMAGWLHDIGKIGVRESVLEKANKLNDDQISTVYERFESIKRGIENKYLQAELNMLKCSQSVNPCKTKELKSRCKKEIAQVEQVFKFIQRINVPGYLVEDDLKLLKCIHQRTFVDRLGSEKQYILPEEYEHLAIIKGNLTKDEYREIQAHVNHTLDILDKMPFTKDLARIPDYAAAHHELLDGSGYPRGLKGDEIPIQSRIMCIADIFDALNSPDRPYKKATPLERTLQILQEEAEAGKLDADIVELFIHRKLYHKPMSEDED